MLDLAEVSAVESIEGHKKGQRINSLPFHNLMKKFILLR